MKKVGGESEGLSGLSVWCVGTIHYREYSHGDYFCCFCLGNFRRKMKNAECSQGQI